MANALRRAIRETWYAALNDERKARIPEVAERIQNAYPDLIARQSHWLIFAAIKRYLNQLAKIETERDEPNLFGFPRIIAIPEQDGSYSYMQVTKARWDDLIAGQRIREENVRRAQQKLDSYRDALEQVRPIMAGTQLTFAEAYQAPQPAEQVQMGLVDETAPK